MPDLVLGQTPSGNPAPLPITEDGLKIPVVIENVNLDIDATGIASELKQDTQTAKLQEQLDKLDELLASLLAGITVDASGHVIWANISDAGGSVTVDDGGGSLTVDGPLTDAQLRANPIEVTGDFASDGLTDDELRASPVPVSDGGASITVDGPITDTQLRALPVAVDGPLTDSQLRDNPVEVEVTNFPATQPVSGPVTDTQLRATPVPVSVSNVATASNQTDGTQKTQLVSNGGTSLGTPGNPIRTDPTGSTAQPVTDNGGSLTVDGPLTDAELRATPVPVSSVAQPADLCISTTGVAGAAVTATLPAVASKFHYITAIRIDLYTTAARIGGATPVGVTSTNIPGSLAWTFPSAGAIGVVDTVIDEMSFPLKSSVVNTPTTIVCPATTNVMWRINVMYYTAS